VTLLGEHFPHPLETERNMHKRAGEVKQIIGKARAQLPKGHQIAVVSHKTMLQYLTATEWHYDLEGIDYFQEPKEFRTLEPCEQIAADAFMPSVAAKKEETADDSDFYE
jgi:hypothetical protein